LSAVVPMPRRLIDQKAGAKPVKRPTTRGSVYTT
jgi:hypothetical protein